MKYPQLQKLITSTMVWAKQTAAIIHEKYSNVPLEEDEYLHRKEIQRKPITWNDSGVCLKYFVPAGQSPVTNIIVCHANIILFLFCKALEVDSGGKLLYHTAVLLV